MKPQTTKEIILWLEECQSLDDFSKRHSTKWIRKDLNSARMKFISKYLHVNPYSNTKENVTLTNIISQWSRNKGYWDVWLVESVMSGVFDEIILKEERK